MASSNFFDTHHMITGYLVGIKKKNLKMRERDGGAFSKSGISFFEIAHIWVDLKLC
jgi:hypothetical protein